MLMLAGASLRSSDRAGAAAERDHRGAAGAGGDLDRGGERRSRDAKAADVQQILVARRAGVGGEVGDGILAKARQEPEDVVARTAAQRVVAGAAVQRVVAGAADQAVGQLVAGQRQTGRPRVRPQELDLRTRLRE